MLYGRKEDILCVRGNCEAEVDQMVLDFPIMEDYAVLTEGEQQIYAAVRELLTDPAAYHQMEHAVNPYGDGHASERIVQAILWHFGRTEETPADFNA